VALTALSAVAIDLVLDPAAVNLGLWGWENPGFYYGVPLINFFGWLVSGAIGALILQAYWGKHPAPKGLAYSGLAIVWFWTWTNLWLGQILPFVIGLAISGGFFYVLLARQAKIALWQNKKQ
jgi:bisanhydrobacterioruberin hydratase